MSYNGSGTFLINSAGQPVVANTVISATVFNSLTADLATGLSTAITKDGQTTVTANIPFGNNKITTLGAGTAATDAANLGQVQSTAAKLITVTGTDTITGSMSPQLTAYAAGQLLYFIANAANTGAVTINVDGLGAKAITRDGSTALAAGDINSGEVVVIVYDGTRFQMINAANSFGNTTINGTLTVTGNTGLQANVSITSALSVGGTFNVTGAATLGSTLSVTGKSDLPTVSTASINAAVALITTGTVTNFTSTSASIASVNAGVALLTTATVTDLTATRASIASANIGNLQFTAASIASINAGVAVITNLTATSASIASANVGTAVITTGTVTNLTSTSASIASANAAVALVTTGTVTNLTSTSASIASANLGTAVATTFRSNSFVEIRSDTANLYWENAANTRYYSTALSGSSTSPTLLTTYFDGAGVLNRLALDASGNLGIGTTSPNNKLQSAYTAPASVPAAGAGGHGVAVGSSGFGLAGGALSSGNAYLQATRWDGSATNYDMVLQPNGGNLGLGVTPSAWWSAIKPLQMSGNGFIGSASNFTYVGANFFYNSSADPVYVASAAASLYEQGTGAHKWYTAPSGTAGNAITFSQAMTLDASGNLGIGTASPATKLDVNGTIRSGTGSGETLSAGSIDVGKDIGLANGQGIVIGGARALTFTTAGNLGLGVTPSAWSGSYYKAIEGGDADNQGAIAFRTDLNGVELFANAYFDGTNNIYKFTGAASVYQNTNGNYKWFIAPSGTAGNAITFSQAMTLDASGNLGIGTTSPLDRLDVVSGSSTNRNRVRNSTSDEAFFLFQNSTTGTTTSSGLAVGIDSSENAYLYNYINSPLIFATNATERARITSDGAFCVGNTSAFGFNNSNTGAYITGSGAGAFSPSGDAGLYVNRVSDDGNLVRFYQDGTEEGNISVSGNTVSYNPFMGSHYTEIVGTMPTLKGTVLESLDELVEGKYSNQDRLPKAKVSDTVGSSAVYGVYFSPDSDAETNDGILAAALGASWVRIASGVTVQRGDLLESNGDGCAKVQSDDIIRSKTIGKVTSTTVADTYADGSYIVPCVLYCG